MEPHIKCLNGVAVEAFAFPVFSKKGALGLHTKKILCSVAALFALLVSAFVIYQIKNPPLPEVESKYTEDKVSLLLHEYASDEEGEELILYGVLVEERYLTDDTVSRFRYIDKNGSCVTAYSDGRREDGECESSLAHEYMTDAETYGTNGFVIPTKYDFDIPDAGEIKIYLNTSDGVKMKLLGEDEYKNSVFYKYFNK